MKNTQNAVKEIRNQFLTGERALFQGHDLRIIDTIFADGESPLKESHDIELLGSMFKWKYPLWYAKNITVRNSIWFEMGRAGVWYTDHIRVSDSAIEAPKNFRRCHDVTLQNVSFPNAAETLWNCDGVSMEQVTALGDYFAMNSQNMEINGLTLYGNYSFDGVKNVTIRNSRLLSKDAFWNSENVTVYDSFISGEYLGWNAKNLTLVNCTIESLQGMCYIDNLVMKNCKLLNTTLAFEYSTVDAQIDSPIDSVMNPASGVIRAQSIGELIMERDKIDPAKTTIVCKQETSAETAKETEANESNFNSGNNTMSEAEKEETGKMQVQVGDIIFTATLEDNEAVREFINMMQQEPVVIQMSDYSGFEKVGSLGKSLSTSNSQTTTHAGDIVLYNGNQIVIFYGSNSWSYTKLGHIDDLTGWEDALGSGNVTVTFSME